MFDALEQKWKQTEQVGENKQFSQTINNSNKKNLHPSSCCPQNGNKRPTVGRVKCASKPWGQLFLISGIGYKLQTLRPVYECATMWSVNASISACERYLKKEKKNHTTNRTFFLSSFSFLQLLICSLYIHKYLKTVTFFFPPKSPSAM